MPMMDCLLCIFHNELLELYVTNIWFGSQAFVAVSELIVN